MQKLESFEKFTVNESSKKCVSFDFDGVLHKSVVGIHPVDILNPEEWEPSENMFKQVMLEAKSNTLVVVTARDSWNKPQLEEFIKMHGLPISKIYCTDNMPKLNTLRSIGAIRHYDDRDISRELRGSGIEFMLVDAKRGTFYKKD